MTLTRREILSGERGVIRDARDPQSPRAEAPSRSLRILILGGTTFLGPHQIRYALVRGHSVSTFTRGRTEPTLFPEIFRNVEALLGDRRDDLASLEGREWDVVIDNSATDPDWVRRSAGLLKGQVGSYLFVSTTGVFLPYRTQGIDESVEPRRVDDPDTGEASSYGVQKALAEDETRQAFPRNHLVIRPHYIVGEGDPTDRFPYWPQRIRRGGTVLVPGRTTDPVQFIDVRDLTEWMIRGLEDGLTGTFNAAGPAAPLSMAEFVYGVQAVTGNPVDWQWISDLDFLDEVGLRYSVPWVMPRGDTLGMSTILSRKAMDHGLTYRPMADTVQTTLEWWDSVPQERREEARFAISQEMEREVLAKWTARGGAA
ncbi:MAG: NAD-dependent epimerase/dehydratase family protein [Gemmatimonadota bacterium]